MHPQSGRSYHERFAPPKVQGVDDITGDPLVRRKDDNVETLQRRLAIFRSQTSPVRTTLIGLRWFSISKVEQTAFQEVAHPMFKEYITLSI